MSTRRSRGNKAAETTQENTVNEHTDVPNFDDTDTALTTETVETDTTNDGDIAGTELDAVDVDVDAPQAVEAEDTVVATGTDAAPKADGETKETKSTRPAVPEGKVSPVAFAKLLTEHLRKQDDRFGPEPRLAEGAEVKPQIVYSYIKNNGEGSKNPVPATKAEGRAAVVDPQAGLEWWDAKDLRVREQKKAAADKAAKKAEKASTTSETVSDAPAEQPALAEAE
jgi:hypothetical protein